MKENSTYVVGLDLGDKTSHVAIINRKSGELEERDFPTTKAAIERTFGGMEQARVALEVGTHSPWVSRTLARLGHEVIVANARQVALIYSNARKNDRADATTLARLADFDPELLAPVEHRSEECQLDLTVVRARDALVRSRSVLVNHVRGAVKSAGGRVRKCSGGSFASKALPDVQEKLRPALSPLLDSIAGLTNQIRQADRQITVLNAKYAATSSLRQVAGVGPIVALAFVLVVGDPKRFRKSREIGPYLGLVPRRNQSGDRDPELRITKKGDQLMRRLLTQSAQYILGPFGPQTDLRAWGLRLAARGRKNAKKRAVVAVARKLAALLHRLWVTGGKYEPIRTLGTNKTSSAKPISAMPCEHGTAG